MSVDEKDLLPPDDRLGRQQAPFVLDCYRNVFVPFSQGRRITRREWKVLIQEKNESVQVFRQDAKRRMQAALSLLQKTLDDFKLRVVELKGSDIQGAYVDSCPDRKPTTPLGVSDYFLRIEKAGVPSAVMSVKLGRRPFLNSLKTPSGDIPIDDHLWIVDYYCPRDSYELPLLFWYAILTAQTRAEYVLMSYTVINAVDTIYTSIMLKGLYPETDTQTVTEQVTLQPNPGNGVGWIGFDVARANISRTIQLITETYREYEEEEELEILRSRPRQNISLIGDGKRIESNMSGLVPQERIDALYDRFQEQTRHLMALLDQRVDAKGAVVAASVKPNLTIEQQQFIPVAFGELNHLYKQVEKLPGSDTALDTMNGTLRFLTEAFAGPEVTTCPVPAPAFGTPVSGEGRLTYLTNAVQNQFMSRGAKAVLLYGPNGGGKTKLMNTIVATVSETIKKSGEVKGDKRELAFGFPVKANDRSPKELHHLYECAQLRARQVDRHALSFVFVDDFQSILGQRGSPAFVGELARLIGSNEFTNVRTIIAGRRPWAYPPALLEIIGAENQIMVDLLDDRSRMQRIVEALPNQPDDLIGFLVAKTGSSASGLCLLAQDLAATMPPSKQPMTAHDMVETSRRQAMRFFELAQRLPAGGMTAFGYSSADLKALLQQVKLRLYLRSLKDPANCQRDAQGKLVGDMSAKCEGEIKALEAQLVSVQRRIETGKYADQQLARTQQADLLRRQTALRLDPKCPPCKGKVEFKDFKADRGTLELTRDDVNLALMAVQNEIAKSTPIEEYLKYLRWNRNPMKPAPQPIDTKCREDTSKVEIRVNRD